MSENNAAGGNVWNPYSRLQPNPKTVEESKHDNRITLLLLLDILLMTSMTVLSIIVGFPEVTSSSTSSKLTIATDSSQNIPLWILAISFGAFFYLVAVRLGCELVPSVCAGFGMGALMVLCAGMLLQGSPAQDQRNAMNEWLTDVVGVSLSAAEIKNVTGEKSVGLLGNGMPVIIEYAQHGNTITLSVVPAPAISV